ncbi:hypothetical protein [Streptomyces platensis]|uniref:hypothetical protein n=1 Tax=Streptomyces platensis TaxID=58346 RepID=UPI002E2544F7
MLETLWTVIVLALVLTGGALVLTGLVWMLITLRRMDPEEQWRDRTAGRSRVRVLADRTFHLVLRVHAHTVGPAVRRYVRWGARGTTRHLRWARRGFGQDAERLFPRSHAVRTAVWDWYCTMPLAGIAYVIKACVLLLVTVNIGVIVTKLVTGVTHLWERSKQANAPWWAPGGSPADPVVEGGGSDRTDPLLALMAALRRVSELIAEKVGAYLSALTDPLGRPMEAIIAAAALVLLAMMLLASRVAWLALRQVARPSYQDHGPHYAEPRTRFAWTRRLLSLRVGTNRENRPVVVLVNCLARVGAAQSYHRWSLRIRSPLTAPRVHLADAERVVWSAWRTRHTAIRGVLRAQHKEHAAEVVGALRMMETRQDTAADRGRVFEDMARMLAKIAERYAQGRTLALLDPEDLSGASRAVNREWIRMVVLGVTVIGSAVGASALGVSDAVIAQVVGIVSLVMVGLLYGSRLTPTDLLDVVRGQSRK